MAPAEVAVTLGRLGSASALLEVLLSGSFGKLGHDTDSILPEVFVQVGLAKELLPGAHTIFHLTKPEAAPCYPGSSDPGVCWHRQDTRVLDSRGCRGRRAAGHARPGAEGSRDTGSA